MNKLWFTNKKKYKNYSENLSQINHKLINKKNTKLTKLAMFSWIPYTSIHSPNIFINVKNHPTFPSSFFDARSLSLIHRGWTTSGGVSNLFQYNSITEFITGSSRLAKLPVDKRGYAFSTVGPLARENLSYYSPNFWTEEPQILAIDNNQVRRYTLHKLLDNFKHKLIMFKSTL